MTMDGEADDFVIDADGDLVPVDEEACDCGQCGHGTGLRAITVITQDMSGELAIRVFGMPSHELVAVLGAVMEELKTKRDCN